MTDRTQRIKKVKIKSIPVLWTSLPLFCGSLSLTCCKLSTSLSARQQNTHVTLLLCFYCQSPGLTPTFFFFFSSASKSIVQKLKRMEPKFAGKPIQAQFLSGQTDLDQMQDTPTRGSRHRRAQSETFFRFPNFDDDILLEDVVTDFNLDVQAPSLMQQQQPANSADSSSTGPVLSAGPFGNNPKPLAHYRSLSVDADFFDGLDFGAAPAENKMMGGGPRHRHTNSMDGSFDFESESLSVKKALAPDKLAELSLIDPKRAKRILANRQSAARSKERKTRYTGELERKVQTLQTEATTLSAQITVLQRDTSGIAAENKELKFRLQALEQQAHLRDALNETLREEVQRLKIEAGQLPAANGNRGMRLHLPPQPQPFVQCGNHHTQHQQQHIPRSTASNQTVPGQSQSGFFNFNSRA